MNKHENPDQPVDAAAAAEALQAIRDTRGKVMNQVGSPPGYYLKLGIGAALIAASQPFNTAIKVPAVVVAAALLGWAIRSYSSHTGSMTMATLREPGAWMAWVMVVVIVGAIGAAMLTQDLVVSLTSAVVLLLVVPTLGPRWDAAWVRSLEGKE